MGLSPPERPRTAKSANPKSAYAVWTSCLGADSQTFRVIADAERATFHDVDSQLKAKNDMIPDLNA